MVPAAAEKAAQIRKLAGLAPKTLALMHGPAWRGDGAAALDALAVATPEQAAATTLAGAWRIVAELGFAPALDLCADCHTPLEPGETVMFSHRAGGALCLRCGRLAPTGRKLPAEARDTLRRFMEDPNAPALDEPSARAHQRLLREFLAEHLTDGRPLRAYEVWERNSWAGTVEAGT